MATLREAAKEIYGINTEAYAADPSQNDIYEFRYKVVDLGDLVASHNSNLQPNDKYPQELQPRLRDRAASKSQIENIARNLNARALLHDTGFIDTGPMIVGPDNVVESGNGRVLGLRMAAADYPQRYRLYKTMLANQADKYGLSEGDIESMERPVLVRERITDVDRVKFARAANVGAVMGMSPFEQAVIDSKKLKPEIVSQLEVGEDQTIDQALRLRANDHIVKHYVGNVPENERATIADAKGNINLQGINRLKLALFTKTYSGESGQRLARIFSESADPQIKSIENAMFQSLPDMAKAEGLIDAGNRDNDLSIAPDLAEVIDAYAGIKTAGITVKDYLAQQAMFEDRLNPMQKDLLNHLDDIARRPKQMREFMRDIAEKIIESPPKGQGSMLGFEPVTKKGVVYGVINRQRQETGREPIAPATATTAGKGLEKPDTGRTGSTTGMAGTVGTGDREDTAGRDTEPAPVMMAGSVQVGLAGLGKESAQVEMFAESNTAAGQGGKKDTLIDIEKEKAKEAAKPLPGQIALPTTPEVTPVSEKKELPSYGDYCQSEDGKKGYMRGSGGLGSDRVKLVDSEGKFIGYYNRSELKPLKKPETKPTDAPESKIKAVRKPTRRTIPVTSGVSDPRSAHSIAIDRALQAQKVTKDTDEWEKSRGRIDLQGYDTPRLSGRGPRITPKTPRLSR